MGVTEQKAKRTEALYLDRAQSLANATRMPIQVWRTGLDPASTGFRIRVGGTYSLVARVIENRWEVATHTRKGTASFCYPTDQAFENAQEQLLEPVVGDALHSLLRRNAALLASPDPQVTAPHVTAPLGPRIWQKIQYALRGVLAMSRRSTKKAIEGEAAEPEATTVIEPAIQSRVPSRPRRSLVTMIAGLATRFGGTKPGLRRRVRESDPSRATADDATIRARLQYIKDLSALAGDPGKNAGAWLSRRGQSTVVKPQPVGASTPRWHREAARRRRS